MKFKHFIVALISALIVLLTSILFSDFLSKACSVAQYGVVFVFAILLIVILICAVIKIGVDSKLAKETATKYTIYSIVGIVITSCAYLIIRLAEIFVIIVRLVVQ